MSVPFPAKRLNLGNWHGGPGRNAVSAAPRLYIGRLPEGQDSGAKMVDVVPGGARWNGEMHPKIFLHHLIIDNIDVDVLPLPANPGVDHRIPTCESDDSKSTPNTRRPPTLLALLDPGRRWRQGVWMKHPGLTHMRMQNNTVTCRQTAQSLFNVVDWPRQCHGHLMTGGRTTCAPQRVDERMMNFGVKGNRLHWMLSSARIAESERQRPRFRFAAGEVLDGRRPAAGA